MLPLHPTHLNLKHSNDTHNSRNSNTSRHTHHTRATNKGLRSWCRGSSSRTLRAATGRLSLACGASNVLALCSRDAGDRGSRRRCRGPEGRGGVAPRGDGVFGGRLVGAVGAVVVADEDVGVDVAEADVVVGVGVAGVDAGFVA
jgi:hypothetical protein